MPIRKAVRESAFNLARRDLATFLEEHEDRLRVVFHEEIVKLDAQIPEENSFIDLNMVGIGDLILTAALRAIRRFLIEVLDTAPGPAARSTARSTSEVKPVENVLFWRRKSQ